MKQQTMKSEHRNDEAIIKDPVPGIRAFAADRWAQANDITFGTDAAFDFGVAWLHCEFENRPTFDVTIPRVEEVEAEIIFAAVNYCFWEGTSSNKPAGGAVLLRDLVRQTRFASSSFTDAIERNTDLIRQRGYPLAEKRVTHLEELAANPAAVREIVRVVQSCDDAALIVRIVLTSFHGFAEDPFAKRALLLPQTFHRCYGLFPNSIGALPVAVDYQIPKVLREFRVLEYSSRLAALVDAQQSIPRHSTLEHELRASVMIACDRLSRQAGLSEAIVDDLLWAARKAVPAPFH